ncbi:uncharacterized protein [Engystomops pustulosus]|uniref:uncharacterized protein isoform X3 n=1 Tax=Engystomops pustulosus TaxID=76066 RepID=UPI003AFAAB4C
MTEGSLFSMNLWHRLHTTIIINRGKDSFSSWRLLFQTPFAGDVFLTRDLGITMDLKFPIEEVGFSINKSRQFLQPCDTGQDCDKKPSLPPDETIEPPSISVPKKSQKRRQRKPKRKKIKAVGVIKGRSTKSGIFPGKIRLNLPKKILEKCTFRGKLRLKIPKNITDPRLICIALVTVFCCHQANSAYICKKFFPDASITLSCNNQDLVLQKQKFCPENGTILYSCTACFRDVSVLEIICDGALPPDITVQRDHRDGALVRITAEDFVEKIQQPLFTRSGKLSPRTDQKDICSSVIVTEFPVVIRQDDKSFTFQEPTLCPNTRKLLKSCTACFTNQTLLKMSCKQKADEDYGSPLVEHGRGRGESIFVELNSEDCLKTGTEVIERLGDQRDVDPSLVSTEKPGDICSSVTVAEFPVVIRQDDKSFTFQEPILCPNTRELLKSCTACFTNQTLLEMSCKQKVDEDYGSPLVEHGRGRGESIFVELNSEDCPKTGPKVSERLGDQSDVDPSLVSTEKPGGRKQASWHGSGIFLILAYFLIVLSAFSK